MFEYSLLYTHSYRVTEYSPSHSSPDPSLTLANILHVTRHIPLWSSKDSSDNLGMPWSQLNEIAGKYFSDAEEAKRELFTTWLAGDPSPTWEQIRCLLIGVGGAQGKRAACEVEETYLKGTLDNQIAYHNSTETYLWHV